jgi:hypothetical protein
MKKYVRLTDKEKVDIIDKYKNGLVPMIQLAEKAGTTRQAIYKMLKSAGIDTSKASAANINVSCSCCGKEIKRMRCQVRKTKHLFCSWPCYFAWLKHGNGNPLVMHRQGQRTARKIVTEYFALRPGNIAHHEDRNQFNNEVYNLKVFMNQGDHVRYHRGFLVPILWDGMIEQSNKVKKINE